MLETRSRDRGPLVSILLLTHDRPHLLPVILACYRQQSYAHRELIVIDDSAGPIDTAAIAGAGGRLVRVERGMPIGAKLNRGVASARGEFCQRMDDDDWYGPDFLERMVGTMLAERTIVCRPSIAGMGDVLCFDVARWELRRKDGPHFLGGTFLFDRADCEDCPFRPVSTSEDTWLLADFAEMGGHMISVPAAESTVYIRHRGHSWMHWDGMVVEDYLQRLPLHTGGPESILPGWVLAFYRQLRRQLPAPPGS